MCIMWKSICPPVSYLVGRLDLSAQAVCITATSAFPDGSGLHHGEKLRRGSVLRGTSREKAKNRKVACYRLAHKASRWKTNIRARWWQAVDAVSGSLSSLHGQGMCKAGDSGCSMWLAVRLSEVGSRLEAGLVCLSPALRASGGWLREQQVITQILISIEKLCCHCQGSSNLSKPI